MNEKVEELDDGKDFFVNVKFLFLFSSFRLKILILAKVGRNNTNFSSSLVTVAMQIERTSLAAELFW